MGNHQPIRKLTCHGLAMVIQHEFQMINTFILDAKEFLPILMEGLGLTVTIATASFIFSSILGLVWTLMRISNVQWLRVTSEVSVNLIRGIPVIVHLFIAYFVLPDFGLEMNATIAAIVGFTIAYSSYQSENFRAGIEAVDRGQMEASITLGMSWWMAMRRTVVPQAFRIMLPSYGNMMVMMLKDSSQASTITVAELAMKGKLIAASTFKNTEVFILVAGLYLVMCLPLIYLIKRLERWSKRGF
jgi:polar amino acid transport system permease protein